MPGPIRVRYKGEVVNLTKWGACKGLSSQSTIAKWKKRGSPEVITDEMFENSHKYRYGVLVDGELLTVMQIMKRFCISRRTVETRLRFHGTDVKSSVFLKKIGAKRNNRKDRWFAFNSDKERERLNAIPGPTEFELKYFPNSGSMGVVSRPAYQQEARLNL